MIKREKNTIIIVKGLLYIQDKLRGYEDNEEEQLKVPEC